MYSPCALCMKVYIKQTALMLWGDQISEELMFREGERWEEKGKEGCMRVEVRNKKRELREGFNILGNMFIRFLTLRY